jgi:hypothetical protein
MEEDKADDPASPPTPKPSPTLSWAMLGFAIGVLFILTLPRRPAETAAPAPLPQPRPAVQILVPPRITTIEAVFSEWGHYAVWDDDLTEVALWNSQTNSFADCFEVLRSGGNVFFRSIPHLTRPLLTHGVPPNSPLAFTETAEQRAEWLGQKTQEDWKAFGQAILNNNHHP